MYSLRRFEPALEQEFNANYYERVAGTLRLVAPLMVALLVVRLAL